MYRWRAISGVELERFASYTFQFVRQRLRHATPDSPIVAIGAELDGQPVGLAVATITNVIDHAEMDSLYVNPAHRRAGVGTGLIAELERTLRARGCRSLSLTYYSGKTATPVLESFLQRNGWSQPGLGGYVHTVDFSVLQASWLKRRSLPAGLELAAWPDVRVNELVALRHSGADGAYPAFLSPFKENMQMEMRSSLCIRDQERGSIVGWSIVFRLADDTWLYDSLFVTDPYRQSGVAFTLLSHSILNQIDAGVPYGMFAVNVSTPGMMEIAKRRFRPYSVKVSEKRNARKVF